MLEGIWEWLRVSKDPMLALAPFFGAILGMVSVLWTQRIIVNARRQEALDEWWYNFTVIEAIKPVINYMSVLQTRLVQKLGYTRVPEIEPYPVTAIGNLKDIIHSKRIDSLLMDAAMVDEYGVPDDYLHIFTGVMSKVQGKLTELAQILVDIHPEKKSDLYQLRKRPEIFEIGKKIDQLICNMPSVPDDKFPDDIKARRSERIEALMESIRVREEQVRIKMEAERQSRSRPEAIQ